MGDRGQPLEPPPVPPREAAGLQLTPRLSDKACGIAHPAWHHPTQPSRCCPHPQPTTDSFQSRCPAPKWPWEVARGWTRKTPGRNHRAGCWWRRGPRTVGSGHEPGGGWREAKWEEQLGKRETKNSPRDLPLPHKHLKVDHGRTHQTLTLRNPGQLSNSARTLWIKAWLPQPKTSHAETHRT